MSERPTSAIRVRAPHRRPRTLPDRAHQQQQQHHDHHAWSRLPARPAAAHAARALLLPKLPCDGRHGSERQRAGCLASTSGTHEARLLLSSCHGPAGALACAEARRPLLPHFRCPPTPAGARWLRSARATLLRSPRYSSCTLPANASAPASSCSPSLVAVKPPAACAGLVRAKLSYGGDEGHSSLAPLACPHAVGRVPANTSCEKGRQAARQTHPIFTHPQRRAAAAGDGPAADQAFRALR